MINPGMTNLYYCNIQRGPMGSISICRKDDNAPFNKPATFWIKETAESVLKLILLGRKVGQIFDWRVVDIDA